MPWLFVWLRCIQSRASRIAGGDVFLMTYEDTYGTYEDTYGTYEDTYGTYEDTYAG